MNDTAPPPPPSPEGIEAALIRAHLRSWGWKDADLQDDELNRTRLWLLRDLVPVTVSKFKNRRK